MRRQLIASTVVLLAALSLPARGHNEPASALPYRDGDRSAVALNILPPGQGKHLNTVELALAQAGAGQPAANANQLQMYEDLVRKAPGLSDADVTALFKDASFGVPDGEVARSYTPREDVMITRDKTYDVPHVYGTTRAGTMFGAGYASAEDRMFMMDVLRHLGRGRLSELLGASDANLASDRAQRLGADYTEEELAAMGQRLLTIDPDLGYLARADLENFAAGVNAYINEMIADPRKLPAEYVALQIVPKPWKLTDSIAESTLIGATFSVGGAGQLRNARFLDALEDEHDAATARAIFDDFRNPNDPEAPTNTSTAFPFNDALPAPDPDAVARPDDTAALAAAMEATTLPPVIDGPFGPIRLATESQASNALLIGPELSATGRPLAVMGPQVGYYSPEILNEIDLHGPGIRARGAAFPGISLYVLLGRGEDYAWSATTAVGDHQDIRAVRLCDATHEGAQDGYLHDGSCRPLYKRTDTFLAKPTAGGVPSSPSPDKVLVSHTTERTHHGIVVARGTVKGDPVAFVRQRSSYGREVDATLTYVTIHDPARIDSLADLQHAFGDFFSYSFNWHLVTGSEYGFLTTGRYPVLADGVDPDLPFWGDSRWDWKRFLTFEEHPQSSGEPEGFITNWNNKQAPLFRASDDNFAYGSVQRKQLLTDGVVAAASDGTVTMTELVQAMGLAATQDLRGAHVLEHALEILSGGSLDARQAAAVALLEGWVSSGAHRADRDGDGNYEDGAAVAVMDALWSPMLEEIFKPALGGAFDDVPLGHSNQPGPGGSAFFGGWYSHASKDLRTILGRPVEGPYSRVYCGGGDLAACRTELLTALDRALDAVTARYQSSDPAAWKVRATCQTVRPPQCDQIDFSPVGVPGQRSMHWQNRPTFQQVVEFLP